MFVSALFVLAPVAAASPLARTPPMGWMSWQVFRCGTDCSQYPADCIGEKLYHTTADSLEAGGYVDAGYDGVHIDDCWESMLRDGSGNLTPNASRFPSGIQSLARHVHSKKATFGIYSDEGTKTCGGYPGSAGYEAADAETFAAWGVDYLKLDGCNEAKPAYPAGYAAMGQALQASGRPIVFSCSWAAYLGSNETVKPFDEMAAAGCQLWRNFNDIQCSWQSLSTIIDHWGNYTESLIKAAGPGRWNDPDMLLIGANVTTKPAQRGQPPISSQTPCLTLAEERTQMAIWSIIAAPLIMGNDARSIKPSSAEILLNRHAIAIDQDNLGRQGGRLDAHSASTPQQVWWRPLSGGDVAVGLYNKDPEGGGAAKATVRFADVGLAGKCVSILEVWSGAMLNCTTEPTYAATVDHHDTLLLRLTPHAP